MIEIIAPLSKPPRNNYFVSVFKGPNTNKGQMSDTDSKAHLRIAHDAIDMLAGALGATAFGVYVYLGRLARYGQAPEPIFGGVVGRGELVRTVRQLSGELDLPRQTLVDAIKRLTSAGLIEARQLNLSQIITLTHYDAHFGEMSAVTSPLLGRDVAVMSPLSGRDVAVTSPLDLRTISNNNNNNSSNNNSKKKEKPSPKRLSLLPIESYKEIQIPDYTKEPTTPITPVKHPLAPPNAVVGIESPLPIEIDDCFVAKPGTVLAQTAVYSAIFWVYPREWNAWAATPGNLDDIDQFIKLQNWAVNQREKFHTNRKYGNCTAWLKSTLGRRGQ
jgi:DNA-binding MarR family transcriptional regulator